MCFDLVRAATQVVIFVPNFDDVPPKIRTLADVYGMIDPPKAVIISLPPERLISQT
jgi:hypothetical protein